MEFMMQNSLPSDLKNHYDANGYYFPLPVLDETELQELQRSFFEFYDKNKERLQSLAPRDQYQILSETHLSVPWVYRLAVHRRILAAVEAILGHDLLIWGSRWFTKMPGDTTYISWHQDATYWALNPPQVTTAWVALSESGPENGCMRVLPGSHKGGLMPQIDTYAADNALSRGQEIAAEVDESEALDLVLRPGEMSLHHIGIVHGSQVNHSLKPRIGIAIRYITPAVVQETHEKPVAVLAQGLDTYGNFELLPPPDDSGIDLQEIQSTAARRMMKSILPGKRN